MAGIARDTDLLLVNRGGVDHQAPVSELRGPSICELEELEEEKMPWEDADAVWHVIITDPDSISVQEGWDVWNLDTLEKTRGINAPGEYIIADLGEGGSPWRSSQGTWEFGPLVKFKPGYSLNGLFMHCPNFVGDISWWDVSNVTSMDVMFQGASSFNGDISNWDVSNVERIHQMFWEARTFNCDIGKWNTKNVNNLNQFMYGANSFNQDLSQWCVPNVHDPMLIVPDSWTKPKPVWGTCPRGEDGKREGLRKRLKRGADS